MVEMMAEPMREVWRQSHSEAAWSPSTIHLEGFVWGVT